MDIRTANFILIKTMNSSIPIGDVLVWDFDLRYNILAMDLPELEVLMIKYEVELKRTAISPRCLSGVEGSGTDEDRYWQITDILGKLYREIMRRRMNDFLEHKTNK